MAKESHSAIQAELMRIIELWTAQGGTWPAEASEIAEFALRNGLYNMTARLKKLCARDLAKAMRGEYLTDTNDRPVRRLHAARFFYSAGDGKKQRTFWANIDSADRPFMEVAFRQRRQQIVEDCCQLNNDVDYYNNRHPSEEPFQKCFDFRDDVEEAKRPGDWHRSAKG